MEKQKRITLNAEKRKVIADVFQDHFEKNSKYHAEHQEAILTYNKLRQEAKVKINDLVRKHQPQEDVDTIRAMINKYGDRNGGIHQKLKKVIMAILERLIKMFILNLEMLIVIF